LYFDILWIYGVWIHFNIKWIIYRGLWLILIGWFLNNAAQSYLYDRELLSVLSGIRLQDIMNTRAISVKEGNNGLLKEVLLLYTILGSQ
jgi:hypothetical protein